MTAAQRAVVEEAAAILRDARALLVDEGWTQGQDSSSPDPEHAEAFDRLIQEASDGVS